MDGRKTVSDGNSKMNDEQRGRLERRGDELIRRINEGTISYDWVMTELQRVIEGRATPTWHEQDGVIHFSLTSDGTTGEEWIVRLESKGFQIGDYAKSVLRSPDFHPTKGVTYQIAILKGESFENNDRTTQKIRVMGKKLKFITPHPEIACLISEAFTDAELEAMGLIWIVVMHKPIKDSGGGPRLLDANRGGNGRWLNAFYDKPDGKWNREYGFAFVLPQV